MIDFQKVKKDLEKSVEHLKDELKRIRAGRANPDLVKGIKVNAYGSQSPIEQLANINVADSSLLTIEPWDKNIVNDVVKAIQTSDIGINPNVDGKLIRLPIPPLTTERRKEYIKILNEKVEEAKISVRRKRQDYLSDITNNDDLSEDRIKGMRNKLQKIVDDINEKIEEVGNKKEKELSNI
jgi:ribosome recycling factor